MRTIFKFTVYVRGNEILLPVGAELRLFASQIDEHYTEHLRLWFEVETEADFSETRTFHVVPTDGVIPAGGVWRASCRTENGTDIWHLYEIS